jgi:hypothetical protein
VPLTSLVGSDLHREAEKALVLARHVAFDQALELLARCHFRLSTPTRPRLRAPEGPYE